MDDEHETFVENLEDAPEEVTRFLFEGGFDAVIEKVKTLLTQKDAAALIEGDVYDTLFETDGATDTLRKDIEALKETPEVKQSIAQLLQEEVFDELALRIEVNEELDQEEAQGQEPAPEIQKPAAGGIINLPKNNIWQNKLQHATASAPATSDASIKTETSAPKVDAYREIPS